MAIDKYGFPPADSPHRTMAEIYFGAPDANQEEEINRRLAEAKDAEAAPEAPAAAEAPAAEEAPVAEEAPAA